MKPVQLPRHYTAAVAASWFVVVTLSVCQGSRALEGQRFACAAENDCASGSRCFNGECRSADAAVFVEDGGRQDSGHPRDGGEDAGSREDAGHDGGFVCAGLGVCPLGTPCVRDTECLTQFCAQGVCCDQRCAEGCATCATSGTCGPKPRGAACDGYLCNGTSLACPTQCMVAPDCATEYTCCRSTVAVYQRCENLGQGNRCIRWPSAASATEDFSAAGLDSNRWYVGAASGQARIENGVLRLFVGDQTEPNGTRYGGLFLNDRVSLIGSSASVEVIDITGLNNSASFAQFELGLLGAGDSERYAIRVASVGGNQELTTEVLSPLVNNRKGHGPYLPGMMRFLRIREERGNLVFEVSADGGSYNAVRREPVPDGGRMSDLQIFFGVYLQDPTGPGPTIFVDNLNLP